MSHWTDAMLRGVVEGSLTRGVVIDRTDSRPAPIDSGQAGRQTRFCVHRQAVCANLLMLRAMIFTIERLLTDATNMALSIRMSGLVSYERRALPEDFEAYQALVCFM